MHSHVMFSQHQMASKFSLSRENFTPLTQAGTPSIIQGYSSGGHHLCRVVELRAVPYGRIFSLLALEAGWTAASSGQKSPSCFSSVHGACVSYLSRVYWFRLNVVLGRPSGPPERRELPASSLGAWAGQTCVHLHQPVWTNLAELKMICSGRKKKKASKFSTNEIKEGMTLCSARERKSGARGEAVALTPSFGLLHSKVRMWRFVPIRELPPCGIFNQKSV